MQSNGQMTAMVKANGNGTTRIAAPRDPFFADSKFLAALEKVISSYISADKLLEIAISTINGDERLAKATPASKYRAVLEAARLGLEPTGAVGGGWLIPRWNGKAKCQEAHFQTSYLGELKIIRRAMKTDRVVVECVYEADEFVYEPTNLDQPIRHVPAIMRRDRGELVLAYALIRLVDGSQYGAVINEDDIDRAKLSSESADKDFSPWNRHEPEMWKKTALRRACKYAPKDAPLPHEIETPDPRIIEVVAEHERRALPAEEHIERARAAADGVRAMVGAGKREPETVVEPVSEERPGISQSDFLRRLKAANISSKHAEAVADRECWPAPAKMAPDQRAELLALLLEERAREEGREPTEHAHDVMAEARRVQRGEQ